MRKLGLPQREAKALISDVAGIARTCSWCIYCHRTEPTFVYHPVHARAEHGDEWHLIVPKLKDQVFEVGADLMTSCAPVRVCIAQDVAIDVVVEPEPDLSTGPWPWARGPTVSSLRAAHADEEEPKRQRRVRWDVPPTSRVKKPGS